MIKQSRYVLIYSAALIAILWAVHSVLFPFVIAIIMAYICDPLVRALSRYVSNRSLPSLVVVLVALGVMGTAAFYAIPQLLRHISALLSHIPEYIERFQRQWMPQISHFSDSLTSLTNNTTKPATTMADTLSHNAVSYFPDMVKKLWSSGLSMMNIISLVFVTPVVTFYMLRDWPKAVDQLWQTIPKPYVPTAKRIAASIDRTLVGYFRGQSMVCCIMACIYATGWWLVGLHFGVTLGITIGLLSFIPFAAIVLGGITAFILGVIQFGFSPELGMTMGVLLLGQVLEGSVVAPKLVGDSVGLHPVWIVFSVFVGGTIAGFIGIVLAVPVAATIGVVCRELIFPHYIRPIVNNKPSP